VVWEGVSPLPTFTLANIIKMIKAIRWFIKKLQGDEDFEIEFEFSIYDLLLAALILSWILWMILR
jgi:hypothetical protein